MTERDRVAVQTYVTRDQKSRWAEEAESLDMSQAEFVRTMVQAGRSGLLAGGDRTNPVEGGSTDATPGGDGMKTALLDLLREEPRSWEELVAGLTGDIEDRIEATLDELQSENRVRHDGRRGGYTLVGDEH
ncbi:DUF5805 domain-containing protein [Halomarina litorea]|uniref:DUF5805 domain-containing protein n=1 Tax=Halomarina litorea TaxID=2961595 RepID=UPI0020C3CF90|nr:DUF5805 domain-containing protein [Halomarina sp. BCD28]